MKLRLLKGIPYNLCDKVKSFPFRDKLFSNSFPKEGRWIIDLKKDIVRDGKDNEITLSFTDELRSFFLQGIKNADVSIEKIDKAEVIFSFINNKPLQVLCTIKAEGKIYSEGVVVYLN